MQILFWLIFFHFITDFGLQKWGIGEHKYGLNKFMLAHAGITTLGSLVPLLYFHYSLSSISQFLLFNLFCHTAVDILRQEIHHQYHLDFTNSIFWTLLSIDQLTHLVTIYFGILWLLG